jgi:hypothetical protein
MVVRAQRLGPPTSLPAASGPPPAASLTARVTEKSGRHRSFPWTAEFVEQLFYFVLLNEAHLDKTTRNWTKMHNSFFKQLTLVEFVVKHSDKYLPCSEMESVRPLKDKYKKVLVDVRQRQVRKDQGQDQDQEVEYPQLDMMVRQIIEEQDNLQWQVDRDQQILSSQRNGEMNGEGDGEDEDMLID